MRIARVDVHGEAHDAIIEGDIAYHLEGSPFENPHRGAAIGPVAGLKLLAPCQPTKIVCIGLNYKDHAAEQNKPLPKEPLLFMKGSTTVIGHGAAIGDGHDHGRGAMHHVATGVEAGHGGFAGIGVHHQVAVAVALVS